MNVDEADIQAVQEMADGLASALKRDEIPWRFPWIDVPHQNGRSRKAYSSYFQILFTSLGYRSAYWHTQHSMDQLGLRPRLGARPRAVWGVFPTQSKSGTAIPSVSKAVRVYNESELDGTAPSRRPRAHPERAAQPEIDHDRLKAWLAALGIELRHSDSGCYYYYPGADPSHRWWSEDHRSGEIWMRPQPSFKSDAQYWATVFHEVIHWTSSPARLGRKLKLPAEELVAELGAIELCRRMRVPIDQELDENHTAYLQSWGWELRQDPQIFFAVCWQVDQALRWLETEAKPKPEPNLTARFFWASLGGA